jgi:hypothetical protein
MAAKEVKFAVEARDKMLHGIDTLAHAVRVTRSWPRARFIRSPFAPAKLNRLRTI